MDDSPLELSISNPNSRHSSNIQNASTNSNLNTLKNSKIYKSLSQPYRKFINRKTGKFGYFGYEPEWLQSILLTPNSFITIICSYVFFQSLTFAGYLPAVLSTIEKRFNFLSTQAGLIISAYDIGSLCVVVFISYYGGKGHRPQWIATGSVIVGLRVIFEMIVFEGLWRDGV